MVAALHVDNASARRLFLDLHGLGGLHLGRLSVAQCQALVERIGFIQVDSINTVERAHHMIAFARHHGYRTSLLPRLVERERSLFENWTHDASLIPMAYYPHWQRKFAQRRERIERHSPQLLPELERIRRHVHEHGALLAREFAHERVGRGSGGWWDWTPSKQALEVLWRCGELAISRRAGFQKVYDLAERVIPAALLAQRPDVQDSIDWACNAALQRLGFARPAEIAQFWNLVSIEEARSWCDREVRAGRLCVVHVQAADGQYASAFAATDLQSRLAQTPAAPDSVRVLSPFDPLIRNRQRLRRLFGFEYRFEAFVPEAKRQWGYYVFPLLERDRLVGRIDMRARRDEDALVIAKLWWEPSVRTGKRRDRRLQQQLQRIASLAGVSHVVRNDG